MASWSDHVRSWIDESDLPVHVVRYEDLHADPLETFTAILDFSGIAVDAVPIAKAIDFASFDLLRAQEAEGGFKERAPTAEGFFRRGQVGSWRDELGPNLAARLIAEHRDTMARLGYPHRAARPQTCTNRSRG